MCPLAARGTGITAGHCGGDAGLVEEDQLLRLELPNLLAEGGPLRLDIGAISLAGTQGLFLRRNPSRRRVRHSVGRLTCVPPRSASNSLYSSSVQSLRSATSARRMVSPAASIPRPRPPLCGLAQRRSSVRAC
jgi:hypothetical protein